MQQGVRGRSLWAAAGEWAGLRELVGREEETDGGGGGVPFLPRKGTGNRVCEDAVYGRLQVRRWGGVGGLWKGVEGRWGAAVCTPLAAAM